MKPMARSPFDRSLPPQVRVGIWANMASAVMLIGIAAFWMASPAFAASGAFSLQPDTDTAVAFAQLTAVFKAVGDVLPPLFALVALVYRQWHVAGLINLITFFLVPVVDMMVWGWFSGLDHVAMHAPFAIPLAIGAWCLIGQSEESP